MLRGHFPVVTCSWSSPDRVVGSSILVQVPASLCPPGGSPGHSPAGPALGALNGLSPLHTPNRINYIFKRCRPAFLASQESHPSWHGRVSQAVELCLHWLKESLYFIKQADRRISRHGHHIDGFNFPNLQMHPLCPCIAAGCGLMPSQSKNQAEIY